MERETAPEIVGWSNHQKLVEIQANLKAPKNRTNAFGQYKYRSAEDILEAAKPLCHSQGS